MSKIKNNILEIIVIGLAIIFALTMAILVVLQELGYMNNSAYVCKNDCLANNMTSVYIDNTCQCCIHTIQNNVKETIIEDRCYEVFDLNET